MSTLASSQEKRNALVIIFDLQSEKQTLLPYDTTSTGKYQRELEHLIEIRENNNGYGVQAIQNVLQTIKARPEKSELALLLQEQESPKIEEKPKSLVPDLPIHAQLPKGYLPVPTSNPDDQRYWYDQWDSTPLQRDFPWLYNYIAYSYEVSPEGYTDHHIACGLWVLSVVAARRLSVSVKSQIYTPLSIAMIARTTLFVKSTTARAAKNVLEKAGLLWLLGADETTPQKLMSDMAGRIPSNYSDMSEEEQEKARRRLGMSGQRGWYYDEFNELLNAMRRSSGPMAGFSGLLRTLDNCPPTYTYTTRANNDETIEKPYLALLGNTTPANLKTHAEKNGELWNDGFWARFNFIAPDERACFTETAKPGEAQMPTPLLKSLVQWNQRLGIPECTIEEITNEDGKGTGRYRLNKGTLPEQKVTFSQEAFKAYDHYRKALFNLLGGKDENGITIGRGLSDDLGGSYGRLPTTALRVAILFASLQGNNHIDMPVWTLAQEIAEMFRRNLHTLYALVATAQDDNTLEDDLIDFLKTQETTITVRDILRYGPNSVRKLKAEGIKGLLRTLEESGIITSKREGKKECYFFAK